MKPSCWFTQQTKSEAEIEDDGEGQRALERLQNRLVLLLAYLAYLRLLRQPPPSEESVLRLLIVVVGLVLVVVALVAAGAADQVGEVLLQWPLIP
jgi:hypothetical protein